MGVTKFGGPDQLRVLDVSEPRPGQGEVRIRVHAATVNPTDTVFRSGRAGNADREGPHIPGMDAAGVIDEVGPGTAWEIGENVMALVVPTGPRGGAYADEIVVPAGSVVRMPPNVGFAASSTLLMNAMTARAALDMLALPAGGTLAVTGAAGAFGGYTVQLAKADGLRVMADASPQDEALVRELGADEVVTRGPDISERIRTTHPGGVDGVADGAVQNEHAAPAIKDGGGLAVLRGWHGNLGRGISVHQVMVVEHATDAAALDALRKQAEQGVLTLRIAQILPAEQAPQAHRLLEASGVRGRLVLDFAS